MRLAASVARFTLHSLADANVAVDAGVSNVNVATLNGTLAIATPRACVWAWGAQNPVEGALCFGLPSKTVAITSTANY